MVRLAFTMRLKPGALAEYTRQHDEIWPDLVAETIWGADYLLKIDLGNGLKGQFHESTDYFTPNLLTFDPAGERLFALTTQGLWEATPPGRKSSQP